MPVVTISAQFGAGAREVGQRLARVLEFDYVDHAVPGGGRAHARRGPQQRRGA